MNHADPHSLVITLPADQMERLEEAVQSGEYASKLDVVMDALKLWEQRNTLESIDDDYLRQEYEAGLASGEPVAVNIRDLLTTFKAAQHARD
ncbi:MAG: CopG family transcriptional regulator [Rhizobium sp.]|nr:CopG family transcriptional regulator [Rhizobium sp.]